VEVIVCLKNKMSIQFQIESIYRHQSRNKVYIFAKWLDTDNNWQLTETSTLGGVPIEKWFDIPRMIDENGDQRTDFFAFALKNDADQTKFEPGQIVELIP
jgi:hypothetical protein